MSFKIVSVQRIASDLVNVRVRMDAKEWTKARNKGQLGQLYGIDISNAAYRQYGVKAHTPTVSDKDRAQGGIKWLELTYRDTEWTSVPDNVIQVDFINKRRVAA